MLQALQVKLHLPGERIKLQDVEPQLLSTFSFQQFIEIIRTMAPEVDVRRLKWRDVQNDLIALEDDRDLQAAMKNLLPLSQEKQLLRVYAPEDTVIPQFDYQLSNRPQPLQDAPTNRAQACDSTQPEVPETQRPPPEVLVVVKAEPIHDEPPVVSPVQLAAGTGLRTGGSSLSTSSSSSSVRKGQQNMGAKQQLSSSSGSSGRIPTAALKLSANVASVVNALKNSRPKAPSSAATNAAAAKIGQVSPTPLFGSVSNNSVPHFSARHAVSGKQPDTNSSGSNVLPAKSSRNDLRLSLPLPQLSSQRAEKRKSTPPSNAFPPQQAFIEASGSCALQRQANIRNGAMEGDSDSSERDEQALLERKRKAQQEKRRRAKANAELRQFARALDRMSAAQNVPEQPPEPLGFPEWLTATQPRKSPYFPQIGDEVVYLWQGHLLYVREVIDQNLYAIDQSNLPYLKYTASIKTEEICRVTELKFVLKPHRLCSLKLAQLNPRNGHKTGTTFTFKYHDMPGVVDFIVLKQFYDQALERNWKPDDLFRTVIGDEAFAGRVAALSPLQADLPDSTFLAVEVTWSVVSPGKYTRLSCWDLEVYEKQDGSVTDFRKFALTDASAKDWPQHGRAAETQRLLAGLDRIEQFAWAKGFCHPVNRADYPTYPARVAYPSDLGTIRDRLVNEFYRRTSAVAFDVKQIYANAHEFNTSRSPIVHYARMLRNVLLTFIEHQSSEESSSNDIDEICGIEIAKLPRSLRFSPEFVAAEVDVATAGDAADADLVGLGGSSVLKRRRSDEASLQEASPAPDGSVGANSASASADLMPSSGPSRALPDNGEPRAAPKKQKQSHTVEASVSRFSTSQAKLPEGFIMRERPKIIDSPSIARARAATGNVMGSDVPRLKMDTSPAPDASVNANDASASAGLMPNSRARHTPKQNGETSAAPMRRQCANRRRQLSVEMPSKPPQAVDAGVRRFLASQTRPPVEFFLRSNPKTVVFPAISGAATENATGPGVLPRVKVEPVEPQESQALAFASGANVGDSGETISDEEYAKRLQAEFDAEVQIVFDAAAPAKNRQLEDDEKLARQLAMDEEDMDMDDHVSDDDNSDYDYGFRPAAASRFAPATASSKTSNLTPAAFRKRFNGASASTDGASTSSGVGAMPFRHGHAAANANGGPSTSTTPQNGAGGMNRGHPQNDRKSAKGGRPGNR